MDSFRSFSRVSAWRLTQFSLSVEKKRSIRFNRGAEAGVKCTYVARMHRQPRFYFVGFVGRVVVHYQMSRHVLRYAGLHLFEKREKLGASMATLHSFDEFPLSDIQRSEQRCGSVALVIVGAGDRFAWDKR